MADNERHAERWSTDPTGIWQAVAQVWIFLSILAFFLIRVLGSQTAQHLISELHQRIH